MSPMTLAQYPCEDMAGTVPASDSTATTGDAAQLVLDCRGRNDAIGSRPPRCVPILAEATADLREHRGTAVCFGAGVALILREYVELDRQVRACLDAGMVCWPEPSAFTRFAIYAGVALLQIFALFSLGLIVDERVRRRGYAPEWR